MKKTLLLCSLFSLSLFAAPSQCSKFYVDGEAPIIVNEKLSPKTTELCSSAYVVMHSGLSKTPLWSAEYITREAIDVKLPRKDNFREDDRLPKQERAELKDYAKSGYDRGHMSPSADFGTSQAQDESFLLSNMIPQDHHNNTGIWSSIESATRYLAKNEGSLYVITGPIYKGSITAIGNGVLVPTMVYKIIYSPKQKKASAYLVNNAPGTQYQVITIAELEILTGINFFPKMNESQKAQKLTLPEPKPHKN